MRGTAVGRAAGRAVDHAIELADATGGPLAEAKVRFNVYTGIESGNALDAGASGRLLPTAAQLGLEPPRYCGQCGRRMVVQVRPDGWWAKCSRHGVVDSVLLGRR